MSESLAAITIRHLQNQFDSDTMQLDPTGRPFAIFPFICPDFGDIELFDDGHEVTVVVGKFTHSHFPPFIQEAPAQGQSAKIAKSVVEFLEALFADQIVLYGSHRGGGGYIYRETMTQDQGTEDEGGEEYFVWSGPVKNDD